ncbi:tRNA lysidine(34) synthetase TilS [Liberibacter sp. Z1]|nr:tRNA lysidine(34) synthetase TilS [Candidatus Liberibacter sp.]
MSLFLSPTESIKSFLRSIVRPAHILVAVSGGSDSVGLLVALHSILMEKSFKGIGLSAVTVDHGVRIDAKDEANYVSELCYKLEIPHAIVCWKGQKPKSGFMASAREARYALISDHAIKISATLAVTAHTFNDQLETIYMRSKRDLSGKGVGLAGISDAVLYDMRLWVCRPFLQCRREDIRAFLSKKNVGWREDPSNVDDRFERVRIRRTVRKEDFEMVFSKVKISQKSRIELGNGLVELVSKHLKVHLQSVISIEREALKADPIFVSYLIRISVAICGGKNFLPGYREMERVMSFVQDGRQGCISIGRVVLDSCKDFIWLTRAVRDLPTQILHPGETAVWDGRFRFTNSSVESMQICSRRQEKIEVSPYLPNRIARRAIISIPSQVGGKPFLSPFSRFLTSFDLPIAHVFYKAFGTAIIPNSPFFYEEA